MSLTVEKVIQNAAQSLQKSPSAKLDAEILLAHVLSISRSALLIAYHQPLSPQQIEAYQSLIARRIKGEPIAYITGHKSFWSLDFKVTPATLIPRPETELLVQLTLDLLPHDRPLKIADLGVGCGAVALSLGVERPTWEIHATDQSPEALAVAAQNAKQFHIENIFFHEGNWCEALPTHNYDAIVSNPPYIAENDPHLLNESLRFEPRQALIGGFDGLQAIRMIIKQAKHYLIPGGWLLLEHGYDQGAVVKGLLEAADYYEVKDYQDLSGHDRVVSGKNK